MKKVFAVIVMINFFILAPLTSVYAGAINIFSLHTWRGDSTGVVPEIQKDFVYGISWRFGWDQIEPYDGQYYWNIVDKAIAEAKKHNKKVMLRFIAGIHTPDWVYKDGTKKITFSPDDLRNSENWKNRPVMDMPLPWDPVFLTKWERFIKEAGKRYNKYPSVFSIQMAGGGWIGEMNLPKAYEKWKEAGYSDEKLINAWKRIIGTYRASLPDTPTNLDINEPLGVKRSNVLEPVIKYVLDKYPGKVYLQQNGLRADMPPNNRIRKILREASQKTTVGYQMMGGKNWLDEETGDRGRAFRNAIEDDASYIEVYADDVNDPKLEGLLKQLSAGNLSSTK